MNRGRLIPVALVLARRDLVRFIRQPARVAAAVGTPLVLWIFLASGVGTDFRPASLDASYGAYLVPGVLTLVAVFAAVFSAISIIEDRNEGWLQAVLASPAPRSAIALGRTLGGATVAWIQAALLVPLIMLTDSGPSVLDALWVLIALYVACFGVTAMGVFLAWRCPTSAAFHAVMNLVFMPMWLLSGAFFPADGASGWLRVIMQINPMSWCTTAIRDALAGAGAGWPLLAAVAFAAVMLAATTWRLSREP